MKLGVVGIVLFNCIFWGSLILICSGIINSDKQEQIKQKEARQKAEDLLQQKINILTGKRLVEIDRISSTSVRLLFENGEFVEFHSIPHHSAGSHIKMK